MANTSRVTVDRSYFEALLRRADFHVTGARDDLSTNITISKLEYDSLLKTSREHILLKNSLYQAGITEETLNLLIAGADSVQDQRKDSGAGLTSFGTWDDEFIKVQYSSKTFPSRVAPSSRDMSWRSQIPTFNPAPGTALYSMGYNGSQHQPHGMDLNRQTSYDIASALDDPGFDDDHDRQSVVDQQLPNNANANIHSHNDKQTLYFSGLSNRTTYSDLLSVIKGGKILSIVMRERSATVFFHDGATEFLAWARKNDIYLCNKRIEVKRATHQGHVNSHIATKIAAGATRNLLIRSALHKGLTEAQIRDDMEHIHNLVIISVRFDKEGDVYVETNSVHNALFARTCMMSRKEYRGCAIEFWADACDVPLPAPVAKNYGAKESVVGWKRVMREEKKTPAVTNRFDLLNIDGDSDEENRTPEDESEEDSDEIRGGGAAVSLSFLEE